MDPRYIPAYWKGEIPSFLEEAFSLSALLRLKGVGLHCGLEYTSFPYFAHVLPYNRYTHSLGVALLIYHFSKDKKAALCGAFHDVATPCFAHVIDFLKGDPIHQEATEKPTSTLLHNDTDVLSFLSARDIKVEEVENDERYPLANNATPKLNCDRLEYTLANFINFGYLSSDETRELLDDLTVALNEEGEEEIQFQHLSSARRFGLLALENSLMYTRKEDRYAMEALSRALKKAIDAGDLEEKDLMGEEAPLIEKWLSSSSGIDFEEYRKLSEVRTSPIEGKAPLFVSSILTKKRYIDPLVLGKGRLSSLCPIFAKNLKAFLDLSFDELLYGYCG